MYVLILSSLSYHNADCSGKKTANINIARSSAAAAAVGPVTRAHHGAGDAAAHGTFAALRVGQHHSPELVAANTADGNHSRCMLFVNVFRMIVHGFSNSHKRSGWSRGGDEDSETKDKLALPTSNNIDIQQDGSSATLPPPQDAHCSCADPPRGRNMKFIDIVRTYIRGRSF